MMRAQLSISIDPNLHKRLEAYRGKINISAVCREALTKFLDKLVGGYGGLTDADRIKLDSLQRDHDLEAFVWQALDYARTHNLTGEHLRAIFTMGIRNHHQIQGVTGLDMIGPDLVRPVNAMRGKEPK